MNAPVYTKYKIPFPFVDIYFIVWQPVRKIAKTIITIQIKIRLTIFWQSFIFYLQNTPSHDLQKPTYY